MLCHFEDRAWASFFGLLWSQKALLPQPAQFATVDFLWLLIGCFGYVEGLEADLSVRGLFAGLLLQSLPVLRLGFD